MRGKYPGLRVSQLPIIGINFNEIRQIANLSIYAVTNTQFECIITPLFQTFRNVVASFRRKYFGLKNVLTNSIVYFLKYRVTFLIYICKYMFIIETKTFDIYDIIGAGDYFFDSH